MANLKPKYVREYFWQTKIRKIMVWIAQIGITVALAFLCAYLFGQRVVITDSSMEPTLQSGDKVLINIMSYKLSSPERGDIIVYRNKDDKNSGLEIRRVIGLPDDTVQIKEGKIFINGEAYIEEQKFAVIENPGLAQDEIMIGSGQYFVLGDNRNNSEDSRHYDVGLIDDKKILGKLWLRYSPLEKFGLVN